MSGRTITFKASDGGSFSGYLATPRSGSGPGLVVLQEIFGVNAHIRAVADGFAADGYLAPGAPIIKPQAFTELEAGWAETL